MKIKNIMSKNIIYCNHDDNIYKIAKLMKKHDIGFLPIIKDKKVVGTVTDRDIVINNLCDKHNTINYLESKSIKVIDKDKDIEEALDIMSKNKIKRLIVNDNNKIVGIISLSDIVSKVDNTKFIDTFKTIYEIDKNEHDYQTEIDEFYL